MGQDILVVLGKLLSVLALVAANGFFVAAEFALVGTRQSRIDELVAQGQPSRSWSPGQRQRSIQARLRPTG